MVLLVSEHNFFVRCFLFLPQSIFNQICQTIKLTSWPEFLPVYNESPSEDMFWKFFLSWLAFSQQLESTIFNYSLALCLFLMGDFFSF